LPDSSVYASKTPVDLKITLSLLGSIGAVTALTTSISFGFVLFYINQVKTRKHDLFFRFKTVLFEFDKFLKDFSVDDEAIHAATSLSSDLKTVEIEEFPHAEWHERVLPICDLLDKRETKDGDDPFFAKRIYDFLAYAESIWAAINMACIRQVIAGNYINLVTKALWIIGLLIPVLLLAYLCPNSDLAPALFASPILFGAGATMLLFEVGYWLHREHRNDLSDFVDFGGPEISEKDRVALAKLGPAGRNIVE